MSWKNPERSPWESSGGYRKKSMKMPRWMRRVRVGDILTNGKKMRVVRAVTFDKYGDLACVCFSILRCSWTGRGTTTLHRYDLLAAGYAPTGKRKRLDKPIDEQIARALDYSNRAKKLVKCCDVVGIVS